MLVDFHSHTLESDGTLAPRDLAKKMRARGVGTFSVTDHDAISAYAKFEGFDAGATVVTGVELNTTYRGNDVHVLGYGFPLDSPEIVSAIAVNRRHREERAETMVERLSAAGAAITLADVRAQAGHADTALGRPHVGRALVRAGYASDLDAAFRDWLGPDGPGYVPQTYMTPFEAVDLVARSGGVPVLAHPGRLRDESIIDELAAAGIVGLEVFYPSHAPGQVARYRAAAARLGLVMTAGSDFHDARHGAGRVGMEVAADDLAPFLALVRERG